MSSDTRTLVPVDANVFLTFDRLDDNQIVQEMKGAALNEYVYEFTDAGQTVRGLSKTGTDDAARIMAVQYGEVLREVDCWLEREDEEAAYFKAKVARFVVNKDGSQIEMDSAIGHKRQPKNILLKSGGRKANPFWYEQGGQKALRNAKQKLMPETIKQAIIKAYVEQGKVRRVRAEEVETPAVPPRPASKPPENPPPAEKGADAPIEPAPVLKPGEKAVIPLKGLTNEQETALTQLAIQKNIDLVARCKADFNRRPAELNYLEAGQLITKMSKEAM